MSVIFFRSSTNSFEFHPPGTSNQTPAAQRYRVFFYYGMPLSVPVPTKIPYLHVAKS
jgi:hypothetical protein